jgi:hypothetical protein
MTDKKEFRPDFVVEDSSGAPVAIIEVKYKIRDADRAYIYSQLEQYLRNSNHGRLGPFTIVADRDTIEIFGGVPGDSEPVRLETSLLSAYDSNYTTRSEHESYLVRLMELWLDDVAHHWRFDPAPAEDRLPSGLVDALRAA